MVRPRAIPSRPRGKSRSLDPRPEPACAGSCGGVTDAILREVDRGGQVFFVHNRVDTIHATALRVQKLVPMVRVAVAHGQMGERHLERVMPDFIERKTDVLVSTMSIELGIDMPTVNTLVVDRTDTLGLAQLHLMDRFGHLPQPAVALVELRRLRVLGAAAGVESLRLRGEDLVLLNRSREVLEAVRFAVGAEVAATTS